MKFTSIAALIAIVIPASMQTQRGNKRDWHTADAVNGEPAEKPDWQTQWLQRKERKNANRSER